MNIIFNWTPQLIDFPDIDLSFTTTTTQKLELHSSVFSLFPYVEWVFLGPSSLLEDGFILIGTPIQFTFINALTGETSSFTFKILKILNGPSSGAKGLSFIYTLILTVPWYFDQKLKSKAYRGTISSIFNQLVEEDLPLLKKESSKSAELETILYRTYQTPGSFIEKYHSLWKGQNNSLPLLFTQIDNTLEMIDTDYIQTAFPWYFGIDYSSPDLLTVQEKLDNSQIADIFYFTSYQFILGGTSDLWSLFNPELLYIYRPDLTTKRAENAPVLNPFGLQTKRFAPVRNRSFDFYTRAYIENSLDKYDQIEAKVVKKHYEEILKNQFFTATGFPNLKIRPGRYIDFYLSKSYPSSQLSLYSQKYLITSVTTLFQGNQSRTELTFATEGFTYQNEKDVLNYLHN